MKNGMTAAASGTEPQPAPQKPAKRREMSGPELDDAYRKIAMEELGAHLLIGDAILERCKDLSMSSYGDPVGAANASARLMNASAHLGKVLAHLAQVERRSRTILETIQRPDPEIAELNARFLAALKNEEFRAVVESGLQRLLAVRHRKPKDEPPAIEYDI